MTRRQLEQAQVVGRIGSWEIDHVAGTVAWSDQMYAVCAVVRGDGPLTSDQFLATVHPDDRAASQAAWAAALAGHTPLDIHHRVSMQDGTVRHVHLRAVTSRDADGRPLTTIGTAQDVTQRAWQEEQLRASHARLQGMLSAMAEGLVVHADDGTITDCNEAATALFGVDRTELLGRRPMDPRWHAVREDGTPYPGEDHPAMQTLRTGRALRDQLMGVYAPQFGLRWLSINTSPIEASSRHGRSGREAVVATIVDITGRKGLVDQLSRTAAQTKDLYDNAPCGYHSLDAQGVFKRINNTELRWLGCSRDEIIGKRRMTDFAVTPGHKAVFAENFSRLVQGGEVSGVEFDLQGAQGERRRVSVSATALRDDHGNFVMSRSVMYDITEVHHTRELLRQLTVQQQAMLDNDLIGIVKLRDRDCIWTNKAVTRIFGYSPQELDGAPSRIIHINDGDYARVGEESAAVLAAGGQYRAQMQCVRKDGSNVWVDMHGVLLDAARRESLWMLCDITELRLAQEQTEFYAYHDPLTGLPNRLLLDDRLQQALAGARRRGNMVAVCYVDLDGFKEVNDELGHACGDEVLIEVARRLQSQVRASDTVSRLGGDEFVILIGPIEEVAECRVVLDRIVAQVTEPVACSPNRMVRISLTVGVAIYPTHGQDADTLLARSDKVMYLGKRLGRNRVLIHGADLAGAPG